MRSETQVGHCNGTGFFRVVDEIALGIVLCVFTDNLDAVLIGSYGTV